MRASPSRPRALGLLAVGALTVAVALDGARRADAAPCRMPKDPAVVVSKKPLVDLGELTDVEVRGGKCFYVVRMKSGETRTVDASRFTLRRAFDVAAVPEQAADVPEGFNGRGTEAPSASIATDDGQRRPAAATRSAAATPPPATRSAAPTPPPATRSATAAPPPATRTPSPARTPVADDAGETGTWRRWIEPDPVSESPEGAIPSNHPAGCVMPARGADVVGRDGRTLGLLVKVEASDGKCLYWVRRDGDAMWVVDASTVRLKP